MADLPHWYDDLHGTLANAFAELGNAIAELGHGFRTFALATVGPDGAPRSRIVVLRDVDEDGGRVRFHTDLRSDKIGEIEGENRVSLLFYDAGRKLQLRLDGQAGVHTISDLPAEPNTASLAEQAFCESRPMSRVCYRVEPGPGTVLENPDGYAHTDVPPSRDGNTEGDPGARHFAAVVVRCDQIEVLYLASEGHRRARFRRNDQGGFAGEWLTP